MKKNTKKLKRKNTKMKPFEKADYQWKGTHIENINEIHELLKSTIGEHVTRQLAREHYHVMQKDAVFLNDKYQVAVRINKSPIEGKDIIHLSIKRIDRSPITDWREKQEIKNQIIGEEYEAVELYPAESRLVDAANQFHLWALPNEEKFDVGWLTSLKSDSSISSESYSVIQRETLSDG